MSPVTLARWQFGITTVYHFFFVPITIGLTWLLAFMQTKWYRTKDESWLRLIKFFSKLFLINFAAGVVTGIVQEFQFGMNWSEYSRFVGDIFGAPLALEALIAFFCESTFIGLWIFGWERLPQKIHLLTIYLTALGSSVSAAFILAANTWMQNPVGAVYNNGRAELANFGDIFTNPFFLTAFPHQIAASFMVAGGLVCGVSGWWLAKGLRDRPDGKPDVETHPGEDRANSLAVKKVGENSTATANRVARRAHHAKKDIEPQRFGRSAWRSAAKMGAWTLLISSLFVIISGDLQAKAEAKLQPMKLAASEGHYTTEEGAPFSVVAIFTPDGTKKVWSFEVPYVLSVLAFNNPNAKVLGIYDLKEEYAKNGFSQADGTRNALQEQFASQLASSKADMDYVPNVWVSYYGFRLMIGLGMFGTLIGAWVLWRMRKGRDPKQSRWWTALMACLPLGPLFANSFGWIFTEMGRQPWLVNGVLPTAAGVSPTASAAEVLTSMIVYTLLYGVIAVVVLKLFLTYIKLGLPELPDHHDEPEDSSVVYFAY